MSVREAESLVKKLSAEFTLTSTKPKKEKSRDLKRVEEELSDLLMAQVEVRVKKRVKRAGLGLQRGDGEHRGGAVTVGNAQLVGGRGLVAELAGPSGRLGQGSRGHQTTRRLAGHR